MSLGHALGIPFRRGGGAVAPDGAPSALILTVDSDTEISGTFTIGSTNHDGHYVYFSSNGVDFVLDQTLIGADNDFEKTGLTAGNTYYFYVTAYKGEIESDPTDTESVTISTLLSNLVFSLKWDGSQFINAITGLALINHGSVTNGEPIVANSGRSGEFIIADVDYLTTPDTVDLSMGDIPFTIALWCNSSDVTVLGQLIIGQYFTDTHQRSWIIQINDLKFYFGVSSNGEATGYQKAASSPISSDTNYFVLAWHNSVANTINIQVDNGTVYSSAHTTGVFDASCDFAMGAIPNGTPIYKFGGRATGYVWKRLLTDPEKAALWAGGTGNSHPFDSTPSKILLMGDKTGGEDITISQAVNTVYTIQNPHLIIGMGDYDGDPATMAQLLTNLTTPKFACPGNHDDWGTTTRIEFNANFNGGGYRKISIPYVDFFLYDFYLKMDESDYNTLWNAYDVTLNARQASTQGQWLINGLAASTAKWKIVAFHNPAWASPSDYPGNPLDLPLATNMQWDWYALGADLILNGHYHFYERLLKNTGSGNVPIIICGTAGNTTDLGRLSAEPDSLAFFNDVVDSDFAGAHLIMMTISSTQLKIDVSGIDVSYNIHAGKDQLILT